MLRQLKNTENSRILNALTEGFHTIREGFHTIREGFHAIGRGPRTKQYITDVRRLWRKPLADLTNPLKPDMTLHRMTDL